MITRHKSKRMPYELPLYPVSMITEEETHIPSPVEHPHPQPPSCGRPNLDIVSIISSKTPSSTVSRFSTFKTLGRHATSAAFVRTSLTTCDVFVFAFDYMDARTLPSPEQLVESTSPWFLDAEMVWWRKFALNMR